MEIKLEKGEYQRVCEIVQSFIDGVKIDSNGELEFPSKADNVVDDILSYLSIG